ncbi:MAG: PQQ-dependent sugar dehydrogenase [Acidobacteria bacterium]|nr:PQQ-dependent sugar dehydrogenase [Acidobacteriota bacterium]
MKRLFVLTAPFLLIVATGCGRLATGALDQASLFDVEHDIVEYIQAPSGFQVASVVEGLTYPSAMTFGSDGRIYVLESYTLPVPGYDARILVIERDGSIDELEIDQRPEGASAVGLTAHEGWLYFTHEQPDGTWGAFRVSERGGNAETVATGFPSTGDHDLNHIVFNERGDLFVGQGSATNSGVVSSADPVNQKWLSKHPGFSDIPCRTIRLTGSTFREENALTEAEDDMTTTGAYQAYGESGATTIEGQSMCTTAIYRIRRGSSAPEMYAWGLRNPVGLAFGLDGNLYVATHGADVRSTRPIVNDPDAIYRVRERAWYGWPDFAGDLRPFTDPRYTPPEKHLAEGHDSIDFLIDHDASGLRAPDRSLLVAALEKHAAVGGMAVIPRSGPFSRWGGQLLVAQMGDFTPLTDPTMEGRSGFSVVAVDPTNGNVTTFVRNRGTGDALPSSSLGLDKGLERPVDVRIGPDGYVYVLDYGVLEISEDGQKVLPKTGRIFRVEPSR